MLLDQFTDTRHRLLSEIVDDRPDLVPRYKTASLDTQETLPESAFADSDRRRFPIHTAEHAVLSKLYAEKQASVVPPSVAERIDTALTLYGVNGDDLTFQTQEKQASTVEDSQYLLPQYKRLRVTSPDEVKLASEHLMSQGHRLKVATLTDAAVRAVTQAAAFGMTEQELPRDVFKYAGLTTCDAGSLIEWVEARAVACVNPQHRESFDKIAKVVEQNFPDDGVLRDRNELIKIATALEEADKQAGLQYLYGRRLLDPVQTVFNMDKVAENAVDLGGQKIPLHILMTVPSDVYEEILGEGVMDAAAGPDGQIDAGQFQALLQTLPADLKTLLRSTLTPYLKA